MTTQYSNNNRFALNALIIFLVIWVGLAIDPVYRADWALENVLVVALLPCLVMLQRRMPLSRLSLCLILVFACLHTLGAHYTYAEVPYDRWFHQISGKSFNDLMGWERNHYDRLVHFCFGLFITYPMREVVLRVSRASGFWALVLPFLVVVSSSTLFELLEWGAAIVFGGDLGMAYLGTQGDVWDAHKDMSLAALGALLATIGVVVVHLVVNQRFFSEIKESLTVKRHEPMGERALAKLWRNRKTHHEADGDVSREVKR